MSFYFLSHAWDVRTAVDGLIVAVGQRQLDPSAVADLDDELVELIRESGQTNLWLDLQNVSSLPGPALEKFMSLNASLQALDCRLYLCNLDPLLRRLLPASLADCLRESPPG